MLGLPGGDPRSKDKHINQRYNPKQRVPRCYQCVFHKSTIALRTKEPPYSFQNLHFNMSTALHVPLYFNKNRNSFGFYISHLVSCFKRCSSHPPSPPGRWRGRPRCGAHTPVPRVTRRCVGVTLRVGRADGAKRGSFQALWALHM